jgi:hypothetical protein
MANKREIRLDVTEEEEDLLVAILAFAPRWPFAPFDEIETLKAKIELAWVEAESRDEDDAHNDWVNREMYGEEVEDD